MDKLNMSFILMELSGCYARFFAVFVSVFLLLSGVGFALNPSQGWHPITQVSTDATGATEWVGTQLCAVNMALRGLSAGTPVCVSVGSSYTGSVGVIVSGTTISADCNAILGHACGTDNVGLTAEIQTVIANKGLQRDISNNFGLINCANDGYVLKWNNAGQTWSCQADTGTTYTGSVGVIVSGTAISADCNVILGHGCGADNIDDSVSGSELEGTFLTNGLLRRTAANTYSTVVDNSINWDAAYAHGALISGAVHGSSIVGGSLLRLANPGAVSFLRVNADNSVTALDAATFRTAIGAGTVSVGNQFALSYYSTADGGTVVDDIVEPTVLGQVLRGNPVGVPVWSTTTFPNTVLQGDLLMATSANAVTVLSDGATAGLALRAGGLVLIRVMVILL